MMAISNRRFVTDAIRAAQPGRYFEA